MFDRTRLAAMLALLIVAGCGGSAGPPAPPPAPVYSVGGVIAGLKSGGMVLSSGSDKLTVPAAATAFTMPTALSQGASYEVRIAAQPPRFTQRCTLANGAGTVGSAAVTSIRVDCADHLALVSTLAGTNNPTKFDIGLPAVFNYPAGLVLDEAGNVYVADGLNDRIAKVTPSGAVSTFVGRTPGQVPTDADLVLGFVEAITRDQDGTFYAVGNNTVRKITRDGAITTLAGAAEAGYADGAGANARFNSPLAIAVDAARNVYVADTLNLRIRKISPAGVVTTIAGSGSRGDSDGPALQASMTEPWGIVADKAGNLYFSERTAGMLRKLSADGIVSTIAGRPGVPVYGDGRALEVTLNQPTGLVVDQDNNLYVAEAAGKIRIVTPAGWVATVAGVYPSASPYFPNIDGPADVATFGEPRAVALDAGGALFVADRGTGRIRKIVEQ